MLANLEGAFNLIIATQGRTVDLEDMDTATTVEVTAAPANMFRNFSGTEEMVIEGREFILSKAQLDERSAPTLQRGVRINDPEFGSETITYVKEMVVLGKILGYRVRTG